MVHMPSFGMWLCLIFFFSIVGGLVVLIVFLTRGRGPATPSQGFAPLHAPAHYVVHGVDKATKADKIWRVVADSEANARVKAELEGMVVTGVVFERYV